MTPKTYITFVLVEKKTKTNVYDVVNISSGLPIGTIKWHGPWRQYCFWPEQKTVWNQECLKAVHKFIVNLMESRKKKAIMYF